MIHVLLPTPDPSAAVRTYRRLVEAPASVRWTLTVAGICSNKVHPDMRPTAAVSEAVRAAAATDGRLRLVEFVNEGRLPHPSDAFPQMLAAEGRPGYYLACVSDTRQVDAFQRLLPLLDAHIHLKPQVDVMLVSRVHAEWNAAPASAGEIRWLAWRADLPVLGDFIRRGSSRYRHRLLAMLVSAMQAGLNVSWTTGPKSQDFYYKGPMTAVPQSWEPADPVQVENILDIPDSD